MTTHDPYRAGMKAYAAGMAQPSMRPSGMPEAAWREWMRGWEDARQQHADAEIKKQEGSDA